MMNNTNLESITEPLICWFQKNARVLPWRERPLPYYVWISEIMLQQTRVEAVKPYFNRFIQALPRVQDLAECPEDRLLKLWEGLGYYNRVRNMQKAAQVLIEEYDGVLPADYEKLLKLPGIGRYTAGAVASIAYGIPVPAVDGNVLRVISRIIENDQDITKQSVKDEIEAMLLAVEPKECPGTFNQSLMELGAVVCLPNGAPLCDRCPVRELCQARIHEKLDVIPKKKEKQKRRIEEKTVLVIRDGFHTVIQKRPSTGLLAGLYELPNLAGHLSREEVLQYLKEQNFLPVRIQPLKEARHIFSHVEWRMTGYMVLVEEMEQSESGMLVIEPERTEEEYPIPAAFSAYARYLQIKLGQEKYES
ncbi:MAG: A/G-specific adenine glycosylase [Lachnospiraceae bacterium]|nr:A/G-specific adenine glycosylase [Lachnospiraceae bacterium]